MSRVLSAIIADDEQALREHLQRRLQILWPDLAIRGLAANGLEAVALLEEEQPDVAFLDIRMPGLSGLEVAQHLPPRCRAVFVTAFDQYAIEAFERAALDYLLKPVSDERLRKTVERLKEHFASDRGQDPALASALADLIKTVARTARPDGHLQWIKARQGDSLKLIPVAEVCYFQAMDKYTEVVTDQGEYLIRATIKQLAEELDPEIFWQIHRKTIVNATRIAKVSRSFTGRHELRLKGRAGILTASRSYGHLFKQM